MQAVGARDDKVLANYFPLALKPNAMSWLMHLPVDSISSWSDLCHEFVGAFTGGHQAHDQASDLHVIPQKGGRESPQVHTEVQPGAVQYSRCSPPRHHQRV